MIKVKLISHTPNPEKTVAAAAKLCYSSVGVEEILENLTDEKTANFVNMLSEIGHESPIEHVSFTFAIEGVSRSLLAQLTRHRLASYSVQSQRYVRNTQFEYVIPPCILEDNNAKEKYIKAMEDAQKCYEDLTALLKEKHKKSFIDSGINEKEADKLSEKKAIEDARFVLPNACETKIVCTFNARSLLNFFSHRCCNRAQWEIRELAIEMLKLVLDVAPNIFKNAGPSCLSGKCKEGKMCCGKTNEVKEFFKSIKQ